MKGWRCLACRVKNAAEDVACENCGVARPVAPASTARPASRRCPMDGTPLSPNGFCDRGQGYPATMACSIACPVCRHALTWDGHCFACFGCTTGKREDWTIPGDRYEIHGGHFIVTERGPRRVCAPDENRAALRVVMQVFQGEISEADGHAELAALFTLAE